MLSWLLKRIIVWRLALLVIVFFAIQLVPFHPTFPYAEQLLEPTGHPLWWSLANFDGVHYIGIATKGYFAQFTQAFFPVYPILMSWVNMLVHNVILSGYLISHISLAIFLYLVYKLICLDHPKQVATRTIIFYLLFPVSFFFAAIYTESFFMALTVGAFLAARKKKWLIAGILGAIASGTRLVGILILPVLFIELWQQQKIKNPLALVKKSWQQLLAISLSASGLLLYMNYLAKNFSDALYFIHAQPVFGAQRSATKLVLLYQVFWRYTKMMVTVDPKSLLYYTVSQEFLLSLLFLVLGIIAFKKTRLSYAVFAALAYILPTLTGTLSSMPRYTLAMFPAFIVLGQIKNKPIRYLLYALCFIFLTVNVSLFTRGYWVS